jgi:tetratricopeptide (TPR) repeat protein
VRYEQGDVDGAVKDYDEAIRLKPDFAVAFYNRAIARSAKGDADGALEDYSEAIRLDPGDVDSLYNRAQIWQERHQPAAAMMDLQNYLAAGGGAQAGDTEKVEETIRELKKAL